MKIYLDDIPLNDAWERFIKALEENNLWGKLSSEKIPLDETALDRVLSEPVWAKISSPHYHSSAMDGFAVSSSNTFGALPTSPITLTNTHTGEVDWFKYLDTGDPLPDWADAVIPIENVEPLDSQGKNAENPRAPASIRIRSAVTPWSNARVIGEDMVVTQLVLPAGHVLRPVDLGAVAAVGHDSILVVRKPLIGIIPTGTELVPIGEPVEVGNIIEYNSIILASQIKSWGAEPIRYPITADSFEAIKDTVLAAAAECDLILINAGSSAGSEDFTARVISELGNVLVHGIAVRPGHPVILGIVTNNSAGNKEIPVIGVPGYPVSAALTGELFVEPLIARWTGRKSFQSQVIKATLTRKITSPAGDDDYVRVAAAKVGDRVVASPLSRGSGVISSLVYADGIVIIPRGTQGLESGTEVNVRLYRAPTEVEQTILALGSHDIILDYIAEFLPRYDRRLSSSNIGSLGGLLALGRQEAHFAGSHLFDPESGDFNLSYIYRYIPETPLKVVNLSWRQQGLYVQKSNPKKIEGLADIARGDVRFINRQRGSGTRILLDFQLEKLGISVDLINGYDREEYSHLSVAASVKSGRTDCGLGIAAGADALGLDFIPQFTERYDLIIPEQYYESDLLAPLFEILSNKEFRTSVNKLPGYNFKNMGDIIAEVK